MNRKGVLGLALALIAIALVRAITYEEFIGESGSGFAVGVAVSIWDWALCIIGLALLVWWYHSKTS